MSVKSSIRLGSGGGGGVATAGFLATALAAATDAAGLAVATVAGALVKLAELLTVLVTEAVMVATVGDRVATVVEVGVTPGATVTTDVMPDAASFAALAAISGALLLAVAAGGVRLEPVMATPGLLAELAVAAGAAPEVAGLVVSLFRSAMFLVNSATRVDASLA